MTRGTFLRRLMVGAAAAVVAPVEAAAPSTNILLTDKGIAPHMIPVSTYSQTARIYESDEILAARIKWLRELDPGRVRARFTV